MRFSNKTAAERVAIARSPNRPGAMDYIDKIFNDFIPLAGDRKCGDDPSIVAGIGFFHGKPVTVIGQRKGKSLEENMECRFGMANPEGYRKAVRIMKQAEKFNRPVITFVDTPGAYPGIEAEARGQGEAIARSIAVMSSLRVPTVSVFIGEGGSGGALAIGVSDRTIMLENSIFSILSPEGFASILWKDKERWREACDVMKLTAQDLKEYGICDQVIPEGSEGANRDDIYIYDKVDRAIKKSLDRIAKKNPEVLVKERYKKLRRIGSKKK